MDLIFLFLFVLDGLVVGVTIGILCLLIFGDKPFARLIRVLLSFAGGILYFIMCVSLAYGENDLSMGTISLIIFGPIVVLLILWLISYMYKK